MRAIAVIDGEHYAPVVRDALADLPYEFVAAVLVGGTEKLREDDDYCVPLAETLDEAIAGHDPEVVVDLSDEPVLGPRERFQVASRVLAAGLPYVGADFRFDPPQFEPFPLPSLAGDRDVVVVAMGRGGPVEPEVVEGVPTLDDLLALSRAGRHAASDHLETAALAGVVTVGCRRCGAGLAGAPFVSNVLEGAALAAARSPDVVVFDGSGAAIPPIAAGARILVAHDLESGLNPYRALISDLVLTMDDGVAAAARALGVPAIRFDLRLRPVKPLAGRSAAVFTTGPAAVDHLDGVVFSSRNLADRDLLRRDLEAVDAEVYVVELKAAAIDVVAETAVARDVEVVLAGNEVVAPGLDEALLALAGLAARAEARDNPVR